MGLFRRKKEESISKKGKDKATKGTPDKKPSSDAKKAEIPKKPESFKKEIDLPTLSQMDEKYGTVIEDKDIDKIRQMMDDKPAEIGGEQFEMPPPMEDTPVDKSFQMPAEMEKISKEEPEVVPPKPEKKAEEPPLPVEVLDSAKVPLFVKIERYREVLDSLHDLRSTVSTLENTVKLQNEIEKMASENRELILTSVKKLNEKVMFMDNEFKNPGSYKKGFKKPNIDLPNKENLDTVVSDLKSQIDSIKDDLKTLT